MKRILFGLVALGLLAYAWPGPFVRTEFTETGTVLELGVMNYAPLTLANTGISEVLTEFYVGKTDPFQLMGWWHIGVGLFLLPQVAPNFTFGVGYKFYTLWQSWEIQEMTWGLYGELGWRYHDFHFGIRATWIGAFVENRPLGAPALSLALTLAF